MIIVNEALRIEIEKEASLASSIGKTLLVGSMLGGGWGIGSGAGMYAGAGKANSGFEMAKTMPKVKSIDYVKTHAPDISYANKDSINKQNRFNKFQKDVIGKEIDRGNLFYSHATKKLSPQIIAGDSASEVLLAHELGHHKDFSKNKGWRPSLMRERAAWANVPTNTPGYKILKSKMLGSYERQAAGSVAGLGAGLLAGLGLLRKMR